MDTETIKHALDLMDEVMENIVVKQHIRIDQNNILKKIPKKETKQVSTTDKTETETESSEPLIERSSDLRVTALSMGSILDSKTHNTNTQTGSETDKAYNYAIEKTNKQKFKTRTPTFIIDV